MDSSPEGCRYDLLGYLKLNKEDEVSIIKDKTHLSRERCKDE